MTTQYNVPKASADAAYSLGFADGAAGNPVREFNDPCLFDFYKQGYADAVPQAAPEVVEEAAPETPAEPVPETPAAATEPETPPAETPPEGEAETKTE